MASVLILQLLSLCSFLLVYGIAHDRLILSLVSRSLPWPEVAYFIFLAGWGGVTVLIMLASWRWPPATRQTGEQRLAVAWLIMLTAVSVLFFETFGYIPGRVLLPVMIMVSLAAFLVLLLARGVGSDGVETWLQAHRKQGANIVLMLAVLLLSPVFLESAFRLATGARPVSTPDYGTRFDFVLSPYVMFAEPSLDEGGTLNAQGFSGPTLDMPKPETEVRVAILGGSTVWGGSLWGTAISDFLEQELQQRYLNKTVRVANFGRQSYISMQELILLQRNVLPLDFDLIVIYDGFNDIGMPQIEPGGVGHPYLFNALERRVILSGRLVNRTVLANFLSGRSAIAASLLVPWGSSTPGGKIEETAAGELEELASEIATEYARNIRQMGVLARAYGSEILIVVQPYVGTKDPLSQEEEALLSPQVRDQKNRILARMRKAAERAVGMSGGHFLDAADVFDGLEEQVFHDPVHVLPVPAHEIMARYLAREIVERIALPPPSSGTSQKPDIPRD